MKSAAKITWPLMLSLAITCLGRPTAAETRAIEFRFQLSADAGSEFSARIPLLSSGFLQARANWTLLAASSASAPAETRLIMILLRPDGAEAARSTGLSPLSFEMRVNDSDVVHFSDKGRAWTIKILNSGAEHRAEVNGTLRVTIPVTAGTLVDTSFTLLGNGNAQELPFTVSGPGRLLVEASWQSEQQSGAPAASVLSVSLIHAGEERIYARRQGPSPLRIEQFVTEQSLDRGARWSVRVLNNGQIKVRGSLKISFAPGS